MELIKNGFVLSRYGTRNPQGAEARGNHHSRDVGPGQERGGNREGGQTIEDWFRTTWNGKQEPKLIIVQRVLRADGQCVES